MPAELYDRLKRHPGFRHAVAADTRITCARRFEPVPAAGSPRVWLEALRLCLQSDAFIGLVFYRAKARMQALRIPVLPRIAHRLARITSQVAIGDPVVIEPGVYIVHGQVVIDGFTEIGRGTSIAPFTTIGLRGSFKGPTVGREVRIGTGAKVLGPIEIGDGSMIGANAVVIESVDAGATVVGVPARPVGAPAKA